MKKTFATINFLFLIFIVGYSQTFTKEKFKFEGNCNLENLVNTLDDNGNKVTAYQCSEQQESTNIYRVYIVAFKEKITDVAEFYRTLKKGYATLGNTTLSTIKGKKAIQLIEDVTIDGQLVKQISTTTFYKNEAVTLVLVTNSSSYSTIITNFKNQFSFL